MAVRMCVSPAELKERAQQAADRQLEVASKKYEATRKKNKQKVSLFKGHMMTTLCSTYMSVECKAVCTYFCFCTCHQLHGRAWVLSDQSASVSVSAITLRCKGAIDMILFLVIPVTDCSYAQWMGCYALPPVLNAPCKLVLQELSYSSGCLSTIYMTQQSALHAAYVSVAVWTSTLHQTVL